MNIRTLSTLLALMTALPAATADPPAPLVFMVKDKPSTRPAPN